MPKKLFYGFIIFICCLIAFLVFNMIRFELTKGDEVQQPPAVTQEAE